MVEHEFHLTDDDIPQDALDDCFKPPSIPTLVQCLHCGQEYDSWRIVYRVYRRSSGDGERRGFWCCPIEGCDGAGFKFDILPVDPEYIDEETGERVWHETDEHDEDCDCLECEQLRDEIDADFAEFERRRAAGEIPEQPPMTDEDVPI